MEIYIKALVMLLSGLGAFLLGFKILSENIEKLANTGLKKLFNKTSKNRFIGVAIGMLVTAIIQSSGATTVMVVGFVNAGIMDLFQATAMIMGANIGTTVTAQLVALSTFDIASYFVVFTFIGIFGAMLSKKEKIKTIFMTLAGLGLVFMALSMMSNSMADFKNSESIVNMLASINNPFVLFIIGIALTALLQSSSALTTIIISMASAGIAIGGGGNSVLYIILGSNIGSCVTALLSSIGASPNAKRASLIHFMFNFFGSFIFIIILLCIPTFMDATFARWFSLPGTQIAMFHTFFNVLCTIIFLPFINVFVKVSEFIIRDKKVKKTTTFLDERFLMTPSIAIQQAGKETIAFGRECLDTLNIAISMFIDRNVDGQKEITERMQNIELVNSEIVNYLLKISSNNSNLTETNEKYISGLHKILIDYSRLAEIADNMMKYTRKEVDKNLDFSSSVIDGINSIREKLNEQFNLTCELFENYTKKTIKKSDDIENCIDQTRSQLINHHIKRLEEGKCSPESNGVFINLISNLERAGDHLSYVAHTIVDISK